MIRNRIVAGAFSCWLAVPAGFAHEGFLPLHEHNPSHHAHGGSPLPDKGGSPHRHDHRHRGEEVFAAASGARYTRLSLSGKRADLWQTGFGVDVAVLPWLHFGGDASYGWFESDEGDAEGWMMPHAHLDVHLPLGPKWELVAGLEVGFPGGDEALVGDHWEWAPHLDLRHDRGAWFFEATISFAAPTGGSDHQHEHTAEEEHEATLHEEGAEHAHEEEEHPSHAGATDHASHDGDFHEVVDPHAERELRYGAALGVRLMDERLTLETRFSGVRVLQGDSDARNYLRAGLRTSWRIRDGIMLSAAASMPVTDAERNRWEASLAVRIAF